MLFRGVHHFFDFVVHHDAFSSLTTLVPLRDALAAALLVHHDVLPTTPLQSLTAMVHSFDALAVLLRCMILVAADGGGLTSAARRRCCRCWNSFSLLSSHAFSLLSSLLVACCSCSISASCGRSEGCVGQHSTPGGCGGQTAPVTELVCGLTLGQRTLGGPATQFAVDAADGRRSLGGPAIGGTATGGLGGTATGPPPPELGGTATRLGGIVTGLGVDAAAGRRGLGGPAIGGCLSCSVSPCFCICLCRLAALDVAPSWAAATGGQ